MKIVFTLAWRNLWRNRKRTLITVSSILFAVLFSMFGASMNRGTHDRMIESMSEFHTGFLRLQDDAFQDQPSMDYAMYADATFFEQVSGLSPFIVGVIPRIETFMLAATDQHTRAVMLIGADFDKESLQNDLYSRIETGSMPDAHSEGVVIGGRLSQRIQASVGDSLILLGQGRFGTTAAGIYEITGIINHPLSDLDNQIVYMPLQSAQFLLNADDHITSLLVVPSQIRHVEYIALDLNQKYASENLQALTWAELMPELLQAIAFDMAGQYLFSGILYIVIGFGLFGTILMMTLERRRELGVLMAVGMKRSILAQVVWIETLFMGLLGVASGLVVGYFILLYFYHNPIPLAGAFEDMVAELGYEPLLVFSMAPSIFWIQAVVILAIAMIVCIYPVYNVFRLNILEASRG